MPSHSAWGIGAFVGGLIVLGCIYYDQRRRTDPDFKNKLKDKRKQRRLSAVSGSTLPDLRDHSSVQQYFLHEVQLGEMLLAQGDIDGGTEHLGIAIAVCGHPEELLRVLGQTLPSQIYHLFLQRLPMYPLCPPPQMGSFGGGFPPGMGMGGPMGMQRGGPPLSMENELE